MINTKRKELDAALLRLQQEAAVSGHIRETVKLCDHCATARAMIINMFDEILGIYTPYRGHEEVSYDLGPTHRTPVEKCEHRCSCDSMGKVRTWCQAADHPCVDCKTTSKERALINKDSSART